MQPPKKALAFLRWFCREDYIEEIEGDLTELYHKTYANAPRKARWVFIWRVLKYFRPEFIRSFKSYQSSKTHILCSKVTSRWPCATW